MDARPPEFPSEAFHFLIMVYDKESRTSRLLLQTLQSIGLKVDFLDEVQLGELELRSIDDSIGNTPAVLVLLSEEMTKDLKSNEVYCMILQKRFNDSSTPRVIPIYSPNKKAISYYTKLPTYITNKVGLDFDPENCEKFSDKIKRIVVTASWFQSSMNGIIKRLSDQERETSWPSVTATTQMAVEHSERSAESLSHNESVTAVAINGRPVDSDMRQKLGLERFPSTQSATVPKECLPDLEDNGTFSLAAQCSESAKSVDFSDPNDSLPEAFTISENVMANFQQLNLQNINTEVPFRHPDGYLNVEQMPEEPDAKAQQDFLDQNVSICTKENTEQTRLGEKDTSLFYMSPGQQTSNDSPQCQLPNNGALGKSRNPTETECFFSDNISDDMSTNRCCSSIQPPLYIPRREENS